MELANLSLQMVQNMKEILNIMNLMDKGKKHGLTGQNLKEAMILEKNVVLADSNGLMVRFMKEIWLMIRWKVFKKVLL